MSGLFWKHVIANEPMEEDSSEQLEMMQDYESEYIPTVSSDFISPLWTQQTGNFTDDTLASRAQSRALAGDDLVRLRPFTGPAATQTIGNFQTIEIRRAHEPLVGKGAPDYHNLIAARQKLRDAELVGNTDLAAYWRRAVNNWN